MISKIRWRHCLSLTLVGSLSLGVAGGVGAADSSADTDLTTRGPAGTVKIAPESGGATAKPASLSAPNSKPLSFKVNYVYRPGGQGPLKPLAEGSVLNSGDHYKIQFTPTEDSYVYIFQVDSSKAIFQLFPMTSFGGVRVDNLNPVKAGVTYHLPAKDKSFKLDNNVGSESILFLAFRQPNQALEQQYESLVKARLSKDNAKANNLQNAINTSFKTRGLAGIVDDSEKKTTTVPWTEKESFTMPVRHLNNLCDDCISMITFEHR
jgi:hypothetical protein